MTGYLLTDGLMYLERVPYDGSYGYHASGQEHATVFSYEAAVDMQRQRPELFIVVDYRGREPEITAVPVLVRK